MYISGYNISGNSNVAVYRADEGVETTMPEPTNAAAKSQVVFFIIPSPAVTGTPPAMMGVDSKRGAGRGCCCDGGRDI